MAETRQNFNHGKNNFTGQTDATDFEVTKVEYTDPKTGKLYILETKIGRLEAPEGYFIGKEPFDTQGDAFDYAVAYGEGRSRVMRQLIGNGMYYCYMHFFKFEDAGSYHSYINVEKWSQKQISKQRENDEMLGLCSLDELRDEGRDFASAEDPTASVGITKVMREQLDTVLEPVEREHLLKAVKAEAADRLEVEMKDGRTVLIRVDGLGSDGEEICVRLEEYRNGEKVREESTDDKTPF